MKMTTEMTDWLREIVSKEPWDEEALVGWANEFLAVYEDEVWERQREERLREEQAKIILLKPHVAPYQHDPTLALPTLPRSPDGQLYGIGFIYDEDRDDRVLIAIDELKEHGGVVAVSEHEGELTIYTQISVGESDIEVCGDTWVITQLFPGQGRWEEAPLPEFDLAQFINQDGRDAERD